MAATSISKILALFVEGTFETWIGIAISLFEKPACMTLHLKCQHSHDSPDRAVDSFRQVTGGGNNVQAPDFFHT